MLAKKDVLLYTMLTLGCSQLMHSMDDKEECRKLSIRAHNLEREYDLAAHFRSGFILGTLKAAEERDADEATGIKWNSLDIYDSGAPKSKPLNIIHESIQKRLDQNHKELQEDLSCCQQWSRERDEAFSRYHSSNAQIVFGAGHWMSDLAKLHYICGDHLYQERKKIIIKMIFEGIDPNQIEYGFYTALAESLDYEDTDFAYFLLRNGAVFNAKTIEKAQRKPAFKELVLSYKNQTK